MTRTSTRARSGSPLHLPGAFELFHPSKELVLKNIWIFGPIYALTLIFSIHDWLWSPAPGTGSHWTDHVSNFIGGSWGFAPTGDYVESAFVGFSIFWFVFVIIVGTAVQIMSQAAQLEASEGKSLHFQRLWDAVKNLGPRMLGLYLLIALLTTVGLLLLIVPGLIVLRRYYLAPYVLLDRKCGIKEAMERSAAMTKPYSGSIWGLIGVTILFGISALIPFIGVFIAFALGTLYSVAPALRYQQLKKLSV